VGAAVVVVELMMLVAGLRGVSGGGGGAGDEVEKGELYGAAEEAEAEVAAAVEVAENAPAAVGALRAGTVSREDLVVLVIVGDGDASAPCDDEDPGRS
jgi:TPP-dependent pyruvate/acetoin dehydrogenase alpha subunit